jgi:hypothetical protein
MKKILLVLAFMFVSCAPTIYQNNCNCNTQNTKDLFTSLTAILSQEKMQIKTSDINIGYLEAIAPPTRNIMTGGTYTNTWIIQFNDGKVNAYAKTLIETKQEMQETINDKNTKL